MDIIFICCFISHIYKVGVRDKYHLPQNRGEKGNVTTTNLACERVSLTDSNNKDLTVSFYSTEGSVISLQKGGSASYYDDVEESITFENVKLPGKKKIGIDVRVCSRVNGLSVMFNG